MAIVIMMIMLSGNYEYGTLTQTGNVITIKGHREWSAVGTLRADGKLQVLWTEIETNRPAHGVYTINDGQILGHWAWADESKINEAGDIEATIPEGDDGPVILSDEMERR